MHASNLKNKIRVEQKSTWKIIWNHRWTSVSGKYISTQYANTKQLKSVPLVWQVVSELMLRLPCTISAAALLLLCRFNRLDCQQVDSSPVLLICCDSEHSPNH